MLTTDSFDDTDHLELLEVELTSKQIEWLQRRADEQNLSLDHVLRSVITAQIRAQGDALENEPRPPRGDGSPSAAAKGSSRGVNPSAGAATETGEDAESAGPSSIVDSLRSASERLQDLTEQGDTADSPPSHDTLRHLQSRLGDAPDADDEAEDASHDTVLVDDQRRSMFDMVEEE